MFACIKVELDAIPYVLLVVRHADDTSPRELPAEMAAAAVELPEDQVDISRRCFMLPSSVFVPLSCELIQL